MLATSIMPTMMPNRFLLLSSAMLALLCGVAESQVLPFLGGDRVGISALAALKIPPDARGAAMGQAMAAVASTPAAAFWNPALLVESPDGFLFSYNPHNAEHTHLFAAGAYGLDADNHIGISLLRYGVPDMAVTTETQPFGTGQTFRARDVAASVSFAHRFTDQFSAGATLRFADESIAGLSARGVLVDIGTLYRTGLGSLRFAVAVQNFGGHIQPKGEVKTMQGDHATFDEFYPPTVFTIGFGYELVDDTAQRLTTALSLNHPNDNEENITLGAEYLLRPIESWEGALLVRAGYKANADAGDISVGGGVFLPLFNGYALTCDYSWVRQPVLQNLQGVTVGVAYAPQK
ncbi:MAG: PorV/PorQ family protein [Chlorobi bacterium]|nr:PorV/PorQ family protein [Chlorobiota bacterium]